MNTQTPETAVASLVLPKDTLQWFDITNAALEDNTVRITLVEKANPPPSNVTLFFKGYKDITITDFPIRGREANLTFRRRYWQHPNTKKYIANDINLAFPGTKLDNEFADFLKDEGGRSPDVTRLDRNRLLSPAEGI